jgi:hypothetical protein
LNTWAEDVLGGGVLAGPGFDPQYHKNKNKTQKKKKGRKEKVVINQAYSNHLIKVMFLVFTQTS